jgi:hypothetical protein
MLGLNSLDRTSGVVWAEVVKRLEDIRTVVYNITADIEGMPGIPDGYVTHVTQDVMVSYELESVRIDTSMQTPRGPVNTKTYILFEDRVLLQLMPFQKKYIEVSISDEHMKKLEKEKGDPVTLLSAMLEHDYVELGRKEINGVIAWGIEVSDPKLGAKMGAFISGGTFDEITVQLWVDEKRELPIRINATGSFSDGKASMETVYDNFQWDIEIESSALEPVIPDDFELLAQTTWESGNEGEVIIEVLQLFLEFADGKYPSSLNTMTVANAIAPALKKKFPQKPGKEVLERLIKVDMVGRMYMILEKDGKDPAYYGDKVTADHPDAVLFRWKIDDNTYRVVFGDLRTEEISAEELMELELAPLSSKPNAQAAITMLTRLPELTQEMYNDIQPDGTIKFRNPQQVVNKGTEPITERRFSNSDFVQLTAMTDEQGNPVEFTAKHEGDVYRYHIIFDPPVTPGETFVYTSEGTITGLVRPVGNKKDTYRYYMTHSPGSGVPTLRIEEYLLPEGAELLSTLSKEITQSAKDGRIVLRIEKVIPAGGNLTTSFKYRLDR